MVRQLNPKRVIQFVRFSVVLTLCWPLRSTSSKNRLNAYRVLQVSHAISTVSIVFVSLYSAYLHLDDLVSVSRIVVVSLAMIQMIITTFICMLKHETLQFIIEDMESYVEKAQQYEREVFSKYIEKSHTFYKISIILCYTAATIFLLGPVVLPISFPLDVEYPFPVNNTVVYVFVYIHQLLVSYQCTAHLCLSGLGGLLLWYTTARFECLAIEFQKSSNVDMMVDCIKKQLRLTRYAEKVTSAIRFIVLSAVAGSTLILIVSGIILIVNSPIIVKIQFTGSIVAVLTEVYMYTWPADYMKDMSENFSRTAYDITWYKQSLRMQKDLLHVLIYHKPVAISISCVMPVLTLEYFCSYLSNAFSIFTALRAVLVNN